MDATHLALQNLICIPTPFIPQHIIFTNGCFGCVFYLFSLTHVCDALVFLAVEDFFLIESGFLYRNCLYLVSLGLIREVLQKTRLKHLY